MEDPARASRDERVAIVAGNLRVDAATAEVVEAFTAAGVQSVVLKGPSIARWLYSELDPRPYRDCDLLVAPDEAGRAGEILTGLGFERHFETETLPEWWREHAGEWRREADGVFVDLHSGLPGVGVDEGTAWRALSADTETIPVSGYAAQALSVPARALHVVLHAAHHGVEWHKPMADLEHALSRVEERTWRGAAELAERLEATDALATGLRLTPAGRDLAARLGLPAGASVAATLQAGTPPPVALGIEQLARAGGTRMRAKIVWRKLVPPAGFMRKWHPLASRGRGGLLLAYLYRPIWLLRSAPAGLRAWKRARRDTSGR